MKIKKMAMILLSFVIAIHTVGCKNIGDGRRIIRIAHSQTVDHPDHIGLLAFEQYIEERLGDKYDVQIFPTELMGSSQKAIELVQTGAIEYVVASTGNLESFDNIYQIFSLPYLFDSLDGFYAVMNNDEFMNSIYESTEAAGFQSVAWFTAGIRNLYAKKPIRTPDDLKGMKIRVQSSPTNVRLMELLGAAAVPMSFGEVYTAIQQGVIDGAENNEMSLVAQKHGEVAKYYTYNQHQMVPDLLVANLKFIKDLSEDERAIFDEAAKVCTQAEVEAWNDQIDKIKLQAEEMGVEFYNPDVELFREKALPLHQEVLEKNTKLKDSYNRIQEIQSDLRAGEVS